MLIRVADLADRISTKDALLRFSGAHKIMDWKKTIMSEIPASPVKLDYQLETNVFPEKLRN